MGNTKDAIMAWTIDMVWSYHFPTDHSFIVNDARRYYISIDQTDIYDVTIKTLYYFELFLMSSLVVLMGVGFYKSYQQQSKRWGKSFVFGLFFFGIEDKNDQDTLCNEKTFKQYEKEIAAATKNSLKIPTTLSSFIPELLILVVVVTMTMLMPNLITLALHLCSIKPRKRKQKQKSHGNPQSKICDLYIWSVRIRHTIRNHGLAIETNRYLICYSI